MFITPFFHLHKSGLPLEYADGIAMRLLCSVLGCVFGTHVLGTHVVGTMLQALG